MHQSATNNALSLSAPTGETGRGHGAAAVASAGRAASEASPSNLTRARIRFEMLCFAGLLLLFNLPLFGGHFSTRYVFHPGAVAAGEWWRLLSHPWVHVSWYHLGLDAAAFFLAYAELNHWRRAVRLGCVAMAGLGSLLTTLLWSPQVVIYGLCGLSGIAHGLTAVVSLEAARGGDTRLERAVGWVGLGATMAKGVIEVLTGRVLFASWHLGWLGTPMAAAHLGGVLGALLVVLANFSIGNCLRTSILSGQRKLSPTKMYGRQEAHGRKETQL